MDAETGAMYAVFTNNRSAEERAAIDDALSVDPADITDTLLALEDGVPAGTASLRPFEQELEVKKVFVGVPFRGQGLSRRIMLELEGIARVRGAASLVLQTGPLQVPAIRLYESLGYVQIEPYGKYGVIEGTLCYRKLLS